MQTFLPYENFVMSAQVLDRQRLGKQRLEALECLNLILDKPLAIVFPDKKIWKSDRHANHPCRWQWQGHPDWLAMYGMFICSEWIARGYVDNQLPIYNLLVNQFDLCPDDSNKPWWLGMEDYHASHRNNLVRKRPDIYAKEWPDADIEGSYIWPETREGK